VVQEREILHIGLEGRDVTEVLGGGVNNAVRGLSQMIGRDISVTNITLREVPVKNIPDLFGGPEALIVGVYLAISGYSEGHMMVIYTPETAFDLIDLLLGQSAGSTQELTEIEQSVLGEVGNIMGSFFLNHLADATGNRFMPSPPAVMMDMAGAILENIMANILITSDKTYIIETVFGTCDRQVTGTFLVAPARGHVNG
jgi:chemotaxis protein CheC